MTWKTAFWGSALALALLALAFSPALSHDAPAGWSYDPACCSNKDCAIEAGKVRAVLGGWLIERVGLVVPYSDSRIKESRDGEFHSCWRYNRRDDPKQLLCLYVPAQGS